MRAGAGQRGARGWGPGREVRVNQGQAREAQSGARRTRVWRLRVGYRVGFMGRGASKPGPSEDSAGA